MRVGRATVIQHPYQGETPTQTRKQQSPWQEIQKESLLAAEEKMENAQELSTRTGKNVKTLLKNLYEIDFDATGGKREIPILGMEFEGTPYVVTLHKSAVGKVISDKNISAEKLAILDTINDVIINGTYVGSSAYVQHGNREKDTIRFDHFERPAIINGKNFIIAFDVECFPSTNNYRTHKVIKEMSVTPVSDTDTGNLPAAPEGLHPSHTNNVAPSAPNGKGKSDGIGAADAGFDPYSAAMNAYGTIDAGENPARPIDTPKRMERDTKVSLTARTVQEAEATPEKRLQTIQDAIVGGTLSYIPVSNAEAAQRAEETIGRDGWSKALNDWTADARAGMASETRRSSRWVPFLTTSFLPSTKDTELTTKWL